MKEFILMQLLRPASQRLGTSVGAFLAANNVASDDANLIMSAIPVMLGLAVDLITRKLF